MPFLAMEAYAFVIRSNDIPSLIPPRVAALVKDCLPTKENLSKVEAKSSKFRHSASRAKTELSLFMSASSNVSCPW